MDLSVVIPTEQPASETEVVNYLQRCSFQDYEIVVRDDVPVTKARNEGYKRAQADKILFLDDDSMPRDGYLERASRTLENEFAVAGKTVHPRNDVFAGQLTSHYGFGDNPGYVDRFWGCNMGLRAEALDAVGGWDENMQWGHEEKELAERVLKRYPIYYDPEMVVDHAYADSLSDYWKKNYRLEKQTPYYLRKQDASDRDILSHLLKRAISPTSYLGRTPLLTLARTGKTIAGTLGGIVGYFSERPSEFESPYHVRSSTRPHNESR